MFLMTFRRFSKIFPKAWRTSKHFSNIVRRFPKVAEDFRGGTDDVSIIQHHLSVLFERSCSYGNSNLKTCNNNLLFSRVKIYMLFAGWEVRMVKNCDRGLENAARGRRPRAAFSSRPRAAFSSPRSQFFTIRTDLSRQITCLFFPAVN